MISRDAATGLIEAIEATGRNADDVLRPLGLDRGLLSNPHGLIPSVDFARVLDETARATGDDCFGLHFGERFHPKDIGPLVYVVLHSPTIAVALDNVARHLRVHNEAAHVSFAIDEKWGYLRHVLAIPADLRRQHDEYSLAVGLRTIRLIAGGRRSRCSSSTSPRLRRMSTADCAEPRLRSTAPPTPSSSSASSVSGRFRPPMHGSIRS